MQVKKESVSNRILKFAKIEFLDKGFENVTIRTIAKKSSISSGTIYTYFKDKNAVFEAIVNPTAKKLFNQMNMTMDGFKRNTNNIEQAFSKQVSREVIVQLFDLIYPKKDDYKLLLCCSKGSSMENFKDRVINTYTELCLSLLESLSQSIGCSKKFSHVSVHMILSLFFIIIEEIILDDVTREQADEYVDELAGVIYGAWNGLINYD